MSVFTPTHQLIADFVGTDSKCLSSKKGELIQVTVENGGWSVSVNSQGKQGYVPTAYLTPYTGFKMINCYLFLIDAAPTSTANTASSGGSSEEYVEAIHEYAGTSLIILYILDFLR
jgi:hypothetical protein